ncbi:MAG: hypothetical protein R2873_21305 [Caldilineaceae bacterium]
MAAAFAAAGDLVHAQREAVEVAQIAGGQALLGAEATPAAVLTEAPSPLLAHRRTWWI